MNRKFITIGLIIILLSIVMLGCASKGGESYINLPEGPKIIFRGGLGKITLRYTPPPDPIFRIANATDYVEFDIVKESYGIPDKPLIVEYIVDSAVISPSILQRTGSPRFNDYIIRVLQSWIYTRYGYGPIRIKVDVAKKRIEVDLSQIRLIEAEPGKPDPKLGSVRDIVRQTGFTVVRAEMY